MTPSPSHDIQWSLASIHNATAIEHRGHLCLIFEDFFSPSLASKIREAFQDRTELGWKRVPLQEDLPRLSLERPDHPIVRSVSELFAAPEILSALGTKIDRRILPAGVSFWKDLEGYDLPLHVDNDAFHCAAQIYVGANTEIALGTSIATEKGDVLFTLPYRGGLGYFLKSANQTLHGLLTPVPKGMERASVYARFRYVSGQVP